MGDTEGGTKNGLHVGSLSNKLDGGTMDGDGET